MSKFEQYVLSFLGFFVFLIIFIRLGFIIGIAITSHTLIFATGLYCLFLICTYTLTLFYGHKKISHFLPVVFFFISLFVFYQGSLYLSKTYDTSWDGQGYHQSAVIAYANGWNPIYSPTIPFTFRLPSQVFAEGYPSALWEMQASIYSLTGIINSAKIMNFVGAFLAWCILFILMRKLTINAVIAFVISFTLVLQPVFLIQALTFMEDGFGYEIILIAAACLVFSMLSAESLFAVTGFLIAELFLVTTKYSHLPIALVLGIIFFLLIVNRFLGKVYKVNAYTVLFIVGFIFTTLLFFILPYGRNQLYHKALFYPVNIPSLMGSVTYNNVPNNLQKNNKLSLLFYGIFSSAQSQQSGDPRSKSNIAMLKIPFTFTKNELVGSAQLYNNRVGGGGPLFSGIIIVVVVLFAIAYFLMDDQRQRYAVYAAGFCSALILGLSLLAPTPNLFRYVNQLQILPFAIIIPLFAYFKKISFQVLCSIVLFLLVVNVGLFAVVVVQKDIHEIQALNSQYHTLRAAKKPYQVRVEQFYSSYIILKEQKIAFTPVASLTCKNSLYLFASSTTTQYCLSE